MRDRAKIEGGVAKNTDETFLERKIKNAIHMLKYLIACGTGFPKKTDETFLGRQNQVCIQVLDQPTYQTMLMLLFLRIQTWVALMKWIAPAGTAL